jgi:hypothetical protein
MKMRNDHDTYATNRPRKRFSAKFRRQRRSVPVDGFYDWGGAYKVAGRCSPCASARRRKFAARIEAPLQSSDRQGAVAGRRLVAHPEVRAALGVRDIVE